MAVTFSQTHGGINVFVKSSQGRTTCLWVNPFHDLVLDTKKRVQNGSDFVWTWNGKPLLDDGVLADYGAVSNGMTIQTFPRQQGGCFMVSLSILFIIICSIVGSMCTCGLSLVVVPFLVPLLFILPLFCL